jgi:hypothetical protein
VTIGGEQFWGAVVAAIIALAASVYTFYKGQEQNRQWSQVEFLLQLHRDFFQRPEIRSCISWLDNPSACAGLEHIFTEKRANLSREEAAVLDQYLELFQFLDNLSLCHSMKMLTLDQVNLFGWYLHRINSLEFIRTYCLQNGFGEVIQLTEELQRHVFARR